MSQFTSTAHWSSARNTRTSLISTSSEPTVMSWSNTIQKLVYHFGDYQHISDEIIQQQQELVEKYSHILAR
ncbi:hypothetical protein RMATCC62417_11142 [Rhizopus microsporus]|nr:hypothetical protein RMATCC62417_11142 [Rhizopus microsporus]